MKNKPTRLTGAQLRAGRALLGISSETLAEESGVSLRTIRRAEIENGTVTMTEANEGLILKALRDRGVIFDFSGNLGVSLRMRPRPPRFES
jgi:hypothetical protein